jgi:hypothetical protein
MRLFLGLWLLLCRCSLGASRPRSQIVSEREKRSGRVRRRTSGPGEVVILAARASVPSMSEISWTRAFTSFALVFFDRSWLSFATRHGWLETWTLDGKLDIVRV